MDTVLLNPNIAYLFLVGGVLLAYFALVSPGTGLLEISALFSLALAGYAVYYTPVHIWALIVLILSIIPFGLAIKNPKRRGENLGLSIFAIVIGSAYLFRGDGWKPAVNIWLVSVVSLLVIAFLWLSITKTIEALETRPAHDLDSLIGDIGEARTDIYDEGSAQIAGELWSVYSKTPILAGTHVRVTKRKGFLLEVESIEE